MIQLFHTKHAVGIRTLSGAELLIHVGLDTVNMNGEGFEAHVKEGDKVKTGDLLLTCRLDLIKEKASSTVIPMVIMNGDAAEPLQFAGANEAKKGQTELFTIKNEGRQGLIPCFFSCAGFSSSQANKYSVNCTS